MKEKDLMEELKEASQSIRPTLKSVRGSGMLPLFAPADINKSDNILTKLVRGICILKGWKVNDLESRLVEQIHRKGRSMTSLSTDRNNMMQALTRDSVSFNKVVQLLTTIFGYDVSLTLILTDREGNREEFNYEDVCDKVRGMKSEETW